MYNAQEIRKLILNLLKIQNKTTSQMLNKLGYNNSLLLDMSRKNTMPSAEKIAKIADYLGCSVDYLLGRTDCPNMLQYDNDGKPIIVGTTESNDSAD